MLLNPKLRAYRDRESGTHRPAPVSATEEPSSVGVPHCRAACCCTSTCLLDFSRPFTCPPGMDITSRLGSARYPNHLAWLGSALGPARAPEQYSAELARAPRPPCALRLLVLLVLHGFMKTQRPSPWPCAARRRLEGTERRAGEVLPPAAAGGQ
jgi:hypothetical protein